MSQQQPITEPTGVYNKFVFNILLQHEISRTRRYPTPIALLHISLVQKDLLPENLERSRQVVAYILNRYLRSADVPAQEGNDFFVLLPLTDLDGGRIVASRILSRLEDSQIGANGRPFKIAVCIGLSWHPGGDSLTSQKIEQEANQAMQEAMRQGPQTLVTFPELQEKLLRNF